MAVVPATLGRVAPGNPPEHGEIATGGFTPRFDSHAGKHPAAEAADSISPAVSVARSD